MDVMSLHDHDLTRGVQHQINWHTAVMTVFARKNLAGVRYNIKHSHVTSKRPLKQLQLTEDIACLNSLSLLKELFKK